MPNSAWLRLIRKTRYRNCQGSGPIAPLLQLDVVAHEDGASMICGDRDTSPRNGPLVAFALPAGLTNGGVTTWALAVSKRLNQKHYPSKLVCHSAWPDHATFKSDDRTDVVHCDGLALGRRHRCNSSVFTYLRVSRSENLHSELVMGSIWDRFSNEP